jgi:hypothetical protein
MRVRRFSLLLLSAALLGLACTAPAQVRAPSPAAARLPADVAAAIKRLERCQHFAGEIGGDGTARDKEVASALRRHRCDSIEATIKTLKRKYRANGPVVARLEAAEEALP